MSDDFDYINEARKARDARIFNEEKIEKVKNQERQRAWENYNQLVSDVLEHLRKAAYPHGKLSSTLTR